MILHDILDLDEEALIFLAEESLNDLLDLPVTSALMEESMEYDESISLEDKGIALHMVHPQEFWLLLTDFFSPNKVLSSFRPSSRGVPVQDEVFLRALIEYFSLALTSGMFCDSCPFPTAPLHLEDRIVRLGPLLKNLIPAESSILEIGCGTGMATQALYRLGYNPWAMDVNRCDVCEGLKAGLLDSTRTFVLDGRLLGRFFPKESFDVVIGFMVGQIENINWPMWKEVLLQASRMSKKQVILTVFTRNEAEKIATLMGGNGWHGELIDNSKSMAIYDQWIYLGKKP